MPTFGIWEVLVILATVAWFAFSFGKFYGRDIERKAQKLFALAERETDPEKKQQLLIEWNELEESKKLRKAFRDALLLGKSAKKDL